ncbi:MAG TPA: glycosyltransferase family 4 protein [Pyrinomonadaceae bacterium]|jgi:glycosyltransferase involved in cell wall biosynthesis|nr:glycosyltransferase family 4 protein [Pyrinomonadaceae bacterium]
MRIVFLNPSGQMGGAEVALLDMLASLREAAPELTLELIVSDGGSVATRAAALGVVTTVLPFPASLSRLGDASLAGPNSNGSNRLQLLRQLAFANPGIAGYVSRLRKLLRQRRPDVIHSNGFKMHLLGAMARPRGVPLVWHVHDYVQSRPFMAALLKVFRKRCSLAIVNSNSVGQDLKAVCGDAFPIQTIYNGVDTKVFSPSGERLDLDFLSGLPPAEPGTIRVGLLGTLARWKGHETFLTALSLLAPDIPVRGYVIGDALYQTDGSQTSLAELQDIARRLGISSRVGFTGFVAEPASAMRALDVVVHASTQREPFGLVIVEAMACGRAVVIGEAGGAAELIDVGENALGHTPGDAAQLAERITQLATDPELRARLGAAGRATAEQRFNRTRLAGELAPIYESLRNSGRQSAIKRQRSDVSEQRTVERGQSRENRD